jgi:hypothetical protein
VTLMGDIDLVAALSAQLGHMRAVLDSGGHRIGSKVGAGDRERIGPGPVVGHLTTPLRGAGGAHRAARRRP